MDNIFKIQKTEHAETQSLLPWYVSGTLEFSERARVERHLATCQECREELASDRRLASTWAAMPLDVEASWLRVRERVRAEEAARERASLGARAADLLHWVGARLGSPVAIAGWAVAAGQALALVAVAINYQAPRPATYHALSAAPAAAEGNAVVMFDPTMSELRFRELLQANHARLVDGPTAAGAYVLHVPLEKRSAVLSRMRLSQGVALAQPIDPDPTR